MKTQILSLAVALISLTSLNVNAKTNDTESVMKKNCFTSMLPSINTYAENEQALMLEDWMTNDALWEMPAKTIMSDVVEPEQALTIEDWMTNAKYWELKNSSNDEASKGGSLNEKALSIERWMSDDAYWN